MLYSNISTQESQKYSAVNSTAATITDRAFVQLTFKNGNPCTGGAQLLQFQKEALAHKFPLHFTCNCRSIGTGSKKKVSDFRI